MATYYQSRGVPGSASQAEIKSAYRQLARKFHPDHNEGHPLAEQRFRLLAEAWEVLQNDATRQKYDRFGDAALVKRGRPDKGGVVGGVERFVSNLERIVEARLKQVPRRGEDRRRVLEVSLEDAVYGARLPVEVTRRERCGDCRGQGAAGGTGLETCHVCDGKGRFKRGTLLRAIEACQFCQGAGTIALTPCVPCQGLGEHDVTRELTAEVPVGVEAGRRLVLRGYGTPGTNGAPAGDLFLEISVRAHRVLTRDGYDLRCTVPIRLLEAVRGGTVTVPLLRGERVTIRIPKRSSSGQTLRLKGRGAPKPDGSAGDLLARVEIETPELASKEALALLEQLDAVSRHPKREAWEAD